jgi:chromosome segregation ATPase
MGVVMEVLLPWWGWLLSGAGGVALVWVLSALVLGGQRRALQRQLAEHQRQLEHLNAQRNDREARVLRLEQRLSDSERERLLAETAQAERDAAIAELQARLQAFDGLQAEAAALHARVATLDADLAARERLVALDEERVALADERNALRAQLDTTSSQLAAQQAEATRLRDEHEATTFAVAQQQAQLAVAEGEREAALLGDAINRAWHTRNADLVTLSALRTELGDFRDAVYRARRRLQVLQNEGLSRPEAAAVANEVAQQIGQRITELLELGRSHQLVASYAEERINEGDQGGAAGLARGLFGYLRDAFERAVESGRAQEPPRAQPAAEDEADVEQAPARNDTL